MQKVVAKGERAYKDGERKCEIDEETVEGVKSRAVVRALRTATI